MRNATLGTDSDLSQLIYDELYYRYEHSVGSCQEWDRFLTGREMNRVITTQNIQSVNLTTIKLLYDEYEIRDRSPETITCTNATQADRIVQRLAGETTGNLSVVCEDKEWLIRNCYGSYPSVCVDCCDPCTVHCSNERDVNFLSSCRPNDGYCEDEFGVRNGIPNSIHIMSVTFSPKNDAPNIISISTEPSTTSVYVVVELDSPGSVYCGVFKDADLPDSLDEIRFQNNLAAGNSSVQTLTIDSLQADTFYGLYCFTIAASGAQQAYELMILDGVANFTTPCCKIVSVAMDSVYIFEGDLYPDFISIVLDALPAESLIVEVSLVNGSFVEFPLFPLTVKFTARSPRQSGTFSLSTVDLRPGAYSIQTALRGASAGQFAVEYFQNLTVLEVLSLEVEPPAPRLSAAVFSNTGSYLALTFDSSTNRGAISASNFACSVIFDFPNANLSTCKWTSDTVVRATPYFNSILPAYQGIDEYNELVRAAGLNAVQVGTTVTLIEGLVKARCAASSCHDWANATGEVVVTSPANGAKPQLSLSSPLIIGACDSLTLDLTASTVHGGRPWLNLSLEVDSTLASLSSQQAVQTFFQNQYVLLPPEPIPKGLLDEDVDYTFYFSACNFWGKCTAVSQTVSVINTTSPYASILSAPVRQVYRYNSLRIASDAYILDACDGVRTKAALEFTWTMRIDNILVEEISSKSNDPSAFLLSSFSLQVGVIYYLNLRVRDVNTGFSATNFIRINVLEGELVAKITGAEEVSLNFDEELVLDASSSFDQDVQVQLVDTFLFQWGCVQVAPTFSDSCGLTFDASNSTKVNAFRGAVVNTTNIVTVTVTDTKNRSSEASVTVLVVGTRIPDLALSLSAPALYYSASTDTFIFNPSAKLKLRGSIDISQTALTGDSFPALQASWAVDDSSLDLAARGLSSTSTNLIPFIENGAQAISLNYVLKGSTLVPSVAYRFSLRVLESFAAINIRANSVPTPGAFYLTPQTGFELTTEFFMLTADWQDEDLPLTYTFGYRSLTRKFNTLQPRSEKSFGSTVLPALIRGGAYSPITIEVRVFDAINANNSATDIVRVAQNVSISDSNLAGSLAAALAARANDPSGTTQIVSVSGSILNSVTCATAPTDCESRYNREPCGAKANVCGECLAGYAGVRRPDNSECKLLGSRIGQAQQRRQLYSGDKCRQDSDCAQSAFEVCLNRRCVTPNVTCASDCSGQGQCNFVNLDTGKAEGSCPLGDVHCDGKCFCNAGFAGEVCQFTSAEYARQTGTRLLLLDALVNQTSVADSDIDTLTTWISVLLTLAQATDQLVTGSLDRLYSIISYVLYTAAFTDIPSEEFEDLFASISALLVAANATDAQSTSISTAQVVSLTQAFAQQLTTDIELDQEPTSLRTTELSLLLQSLRVYTPGITYSTLQFPQTNLEEYNLMAPHQLTIPNFLGDENQGVMVTSYFVASRFYDNAADFAWLSNPLAVEFQGVGGNIGLNCSSGLEQDCEMQLVLQYNQLVDRIEPFEEIRFTRCYDRDFYVQPYSCRTNPGVDIEVECPGKPGIVVDRCPILNVSTICMNLADSSSVLGSCDVLESTTYNVTCSCRVDLDGAASSSRRLADSSSFSSLSVSYGTTSDTTTLSFDQFFNENNDSSEFNPSFIVLITMCVYTCVVLVMACISYGRDNTGKKKKIRKLKRWRRKVTPDNGKNRQRNVVIAQDSTQEDLDRVYAFEEDDADVDIKPAKPNDGFAVPISGVDAVQPHELPSVMDFKIIKIKHLEDALPFVLRKAFPFLQKLRNEMLVYHRWLSVLAHHSVYYSRLMRLSALAAQVLCAAAFQAAIYDFTDPDDGSCGVRDDERDCIKDDSDFFSGSKPKCVWELRTHSCHFRQPDVSYQTIIIIAGLSAAMSVPIARLIEFALLKFIASFDHEVPHHAHVSKGSSTKSPRVDDGPSPSWAKALIAPWRDGTGRGGDADHRQAYAVNNESSKNSLNLLAFISSKSEFSGRDGASVVAPNLQRIRCVTFINNLPLEAEIEMLQSRIRNYTDSLTFLGNGSERLSALRKFTKYKFHCILHN